jgi:hypothetical protein
MMLIGKNVLMRSPLLRECAHTGCRTLTMGTAGALCIRHDLRVAGPFPRGRPYVLIETAAREYELATPRELVAVGGQSRL